MTTSNPNEIEQELARVTEGLPKEKKQQIVQFVTTHISHFSGPLPPPEIIKEYSKIVEGGAERIFQMAEKEQQHQNHLERHVAEKRLKQIDRSSFFAFTLGMTGMLAAIFLGITNHDWLAGIIATTVIGSLSCTFIIGKKLGNKQ